MFTALHFYFINHTQYFLLCTAQKEKSVVSVKKVEDSDLLENQGEISPKASLFAVLFDVLWWTTIRFSGPLSMLARTT